MLRLFRRTTGPPSPADVMGRLIIQKYVIVTGLATPPPDVSHALLARKDAEGTRLLDELRLRRSAARRSLQDGGLWEHMSAAEQRFLATEPDAITPQMIQDVSWSMEAAACMLWALGYVDTLPPYDTEADIDSLKRMPSGSMPELLKAGALRTPEQLSSVRDVAELWHWRSRTRQLMENRDNVALPPGVSLEDVVREAAAHAASNGDIPTPIDGDFPVFGKAYARISAEEWFRATSIALERHRALNWLCGRAPRNRWEDTRTDT